MVGRPRLDYLTEFLLDLVVQREGIKLGVTQQHAGHSNAQRCRHAVCELRCRLIPVKLCLGQADLQPQLQVPAQWLPMRCAVSDAPCIVVGGHLDLPVGTHPSGA